MSDSMFEPREEQLVDAQFIKQFTGGDKLYVRKSALSSVATITAIRANALLVLVNCCLSREEIDRMISKAGLPDIDASLQQKGDAFSVVAATNNPSPVLYTWLLENTQRTFLKNCVPFACSVLHGESLGDKKATHLSFNDNTFSVHYSN